MKVAELEVLVAKLNATVKVLVERDAVHHAEIKALRAKRQPDTLDRRQAGLSAWEAARQAINAERGVPAKTWVNAVDVRARMEPVTAPPPSDNLEEVAL